MRTRLAATGIESMGRSSIKPIYDPNACSRLMPRHTLPPRFVWPRNTGDSTKVGASTGD